VTASVAGGLSYDGTVSDHRPPDLLGLLLADRSEPDRDGAAPDDAQLATLLEVATTVPDHGALRPWRFVVVRGPGRDRFGGALVEGLVGKRGTDLPDAVVDKMRAKAFAAPCQVLLVASPRAGSNVPEWEQVASASCTGYAIVLAATALGLGAVWKSAPVLDTPPVRALVGAGHGERLLGWVNLGTPAGARRERDREEPSWTSHVAFLDGADDRPLAARGA
jgi:nitroreductase